MTAPFSSINFPITYYSSTGFIAKSGIRPDRGSDANQEFIILLEL